jgi:hypothetical protein
MARPRQDGTGVIIFGRAHLLIILKIMLKLFYYESLPTFRNVSSKTLLVSEDRGITFLRNVGKYTLFYTTLGLRSDVLL